MFRVAAMQRYEDMFSLHYLGQSSASNESMLFINREPAGKKQKRAWGLKLDLEVRKGTSVWLVRARWQFLHCVDAQHQCKLYVRPSITQMSRVISSDRSLMVHHVKY